MSRMPGIYKRKTPPPRTRPLHTGPGLGVWTSVGSIWWVWTVGWTIRPTGPVGILTIVMTHGHNPGGIHGEATLGHRTANFYGTMVNLLAMILHHGVNLSIMALAMNLSHLSLILRRLAMVLTHLDMSHLSMILVDLAMSLGHLSMILAHLAMIQGTLAMILAYLAMVLANLSMILANLSKIWANLSMILINLAAMPLSMIHLSKWSIAVWSIIGGL